MKIDRRNVWDRRYTRRKVRITTLVGARVIRIRRGRTKKCGREGGQESVQNKKIMEPLR